MKWFWDLIWKAWYPILTRLTRDARVTFLNYGFDDPAVPGPTLQPRDEPDRVCIQLYHRVASAIDLHGLNVLEVSCGHGGGASYVTRYLGPATLRGVDRNAAAVELCRATHQVPGLAFSIGDATALGFPDATFDAVVNVEASHCYPDFPQFLREVRRVLRPGGHLLFADFRHTATNLDTFRVQLAASGLERLRCDDISRHVVRGMDRNTDRSLQLIRDLIPSPIRRGAKRFAGVAGSPIHNDLTSGATVYLHYVLRKPNTLV